MGSSITYSAWACARLIDEKAGPNCSGVLHAHETQFDRQRWRRSLEVLDRLCVPRCMRIPQDCHPSDSGNSFPEQLQPLGAEFGKHRRESGDVAARVREAGDQAGSDWITDDGHDDGNGRRGALDRQGCNRVLHDDHLDLAMNQVGDQLR